MHTHPNKNVIRSLFVGSLLATPFVATQAHAGILQGLADSLAGGDPFMWLIAFSLLTAFGLMIERGIALYTKLGTNAAELYEEVHTKITSGDVKGAQALCSDDDTAVLPRILGAALSKAGKPEKVVQEAVDERELEVLPDLTKRTPFLSMIANVATLLGLLGTIIGLIQAFASLAAADPSQKQIMLAQGISIAMNTTAFGLIVAIPCMVAHSLLMSKTQAIIEDIDQYSVKIVNLLAKTSG